MKIPNQFVFIECLINLFFAFMLLAIIAAFISVPFQAFYNTKTTQKAINQQCKTNYTFNEVLFASEDLLKLCQTKQQTITVK